MKNSKGRGVIRFGDKTSHGGKVVSTQSACKVQGKPIALEGDMTYCPKCKGSFPIHVVQGERYHQGKAVAYEGDLTGCGAELISSL